MRAIVILFVTIFGFAITILGTTGVPLPTIQQQVQCGSQTISVHASSQLRLSNFRFIVRSKITTQDKEKLLSCATENFRQYVKHRKLRDHKIQEIEITGEKSLTIRGGVRAYQNRNLHRWIDVSARPNLSLEGGAASLNYTYNLHGIPGWAEPDPKPVRITGDQLKSMIPCVDIVDIEMQIGTEYVGYVTFAPKPVACARWWWSKAEVQT